MSATDNGQNVLDIDTDYIFVYPIQPPGRSTAWMRVVAQASWTVSFGDWAGGATSFEPWLNDSGGDVAGTECGTTDGYERPDYPDSTAGAHPSPSGSRSIPTRWGTPRALRHCSARPQRAPDDWDMGLAGYS